MSNNVTMQQLIQRFENRLKGPDSHGSGGGKEPRFPMLVVCLGEDAIRGCGDIASNLFQIWPQYQPELQFLGVKVDEKGTAYYHIEGRDGDFDQTQISLDEAGVILSKIFGARSHFHDKNKLCMYFVLDTTSFTIREEFLAWIKMIQVVKNDLGVNDLDILDMLVLQINENFSRRNIALQLRNELSTSYNREKFCQSVFLLSNRRDDNTILEEWGICYRIIAVIMALSNNEDVSISEKLFGRRIFTVSYAHKEKPCWDIGQVIVENLMDKLESLVQKLGSGGGTAGLMEDSTLPARLGLSQEGTMTILDSYVDRVLLSQLPTREQLEHFPRQDSEDYGLLSELTGEEFNELTMNAWDSFLEQIVKKARSSDWSGDYAKLLAKNFFADELAFLQDHLEAVQSRLLQAKAPPQDQNVMSSAPAKLKYMLSRNPETIQSFVDVIRTQGEKARIYAQERNRLLHSRSALFPVDDSTIKSFYRVKMRDYFDLHESELEKELKSISDIEGLQRFLENTIDEIISGDPVFSQPFEDEFESRLRADNRPEDAKQYIQQSLTVNDVYKYLQVNFNLGQPVLSAVLLKEGTPLFENLHANLSPNTYYYNTGYSNMAEAIVIYNIRTDDLINGGGE